MRVHIDNPEFQGIVADLKKHLSQSKIDELRESINRGSLSNHSSDFYAGMISTLIYCLDVEAQTSPEDQSRARHYGALMVVLTGEIRVSAKLTVNHPEGN